MFVNRYFLHTFQGNRDRKTESLNVALTKFSAEREQKKIALTAPVPIAEVGESPQIA